MRLDFNVLWVDDQPASVAAQITSIKSKMAAEGFDFKPRQCMTIAEVESVIHEVDWDLGNEMHGEDAIERIRQIVQYKDVVFYSGQATALELRTKVYERQLEGVYCAGRAELVTEVIGVFESLIKKVLDLDHTRGIVMGATSDIDYMVKTCLAVAHDKLDEAGKVDLIRDALRRVQKKVDSLTKQGQKLQAAQNMEDIFKAHMLFTSDDRLRMLGNILERAEYTSYSAGVATVNSYREGVVRERNTLGHAVLVPQGKPSSVIDDVGNTVDIEKMRELRKLILNLRADFRSLLDAMRT
jgi:hypothetical protein